MVFALHERWSIWTQRDMTMLVPNGSDKDFFYYIDNDDSFFFTVALNRKYVFLFTKKEILQVHHMFDSPA